jgi:hypothetical protein
MDTSDLVLIGIVVLMTITSGVEYMMGAKQLSKSTFLWAAVIACFFVVSFFVRTPN